MYPYWLEIGSFRLPTFGPMVVLGFLVAHYVIKRELQRRKIDPELASNLVTAAVVGGLIGAKSWFVIFELPPWADWGDTLSAVFSGSGLTWHGGFLLATGLVIWTIRRHAAPLPHVADAVGMGLAIGYGIGRIGCQLAGDGDYGIPTDLPWGMAYPNGVVPTNEVVHPAPVYETLAGAAIFALLWTTRRWFERWPGLSFSVYLLLAGTSRLLVEFIRRNPEAALGLTWAQWVSLGMMVAGLTIASRLLTRPPGAHDASL
ncbi:MAG: prolipoprotein diacylglyceryl transferase [Gemmatimonadetes bacterium]|nr:prolipoprotein diacylglyceryl transferase [Gemmatimonadota bacterium]MBT7859902.1 prolipoprotein diacylglyceryl transferase [Gemmatimonadota bacterium]